VPALHQMKEEAAETERRCKELATARSSSAKLAAVEDPNASE
jgi:hypothetical protein